MAGTTFLMARSNYDAQLPHNQFPYQILTFYTLRFLRYGSINTVRVKVIKARLKIESRSNYDEAQLHPLTIFPTKYQFRTSCGL